MAPRKLRPQQRRIAWPLTPNQVEAIDEMLQTLYKAVRDLETNVTAVSSASSAAPAQTVIFLPSDSGGGSDDGMFLVGGAGSGSGGVTIAQVTAAVSLGI